MSWSGLGIGCAFLLLAVPFIVAKPSFPLPSQGLLSIFLAEGPHLGCIRSAPPVPSSCLRVVSLCVLPGFVRS